MATGQSNQWTLRFGEDEIVGAAKRDLLDRSGQPREVRGSSGLAAPTLRDHPRGEIDGVHPADQQRQRAREITRAAAGVEHDAGAARESGEKREQLGRVRRPVAVAPELTDRSSNHSAYPRAHPRGSCSHGHPRQCTRRLAPEPRFTCAPDRTPSAR